MSSRPIQRLAQLRGASSSARRASTRLAGPSYTTLSANNPTTRHQIRHTERSSPAVAVAFTGLLSKRLFGSTAQRRNESAAAEDEEDAGSYSEADHEHAVISTFDLFSIGIGPSSSHTVGPMRAGNIFVADLAEANLLHKVNKIRVSIYGSLALTGEGHMTPSALLLGLESADVETVDTAYVPERFTEIKASKKLFLGQGLSDGKGKEVAFDYERDFVWEWGRKLPMHSNGMRFTVFDDEGYVLATNDMFSVGGGFVVNGSLSINPDASPASSSSMTQVDSPDGETTGRHPADLAENMFYKEIRRSDAAGDRRTGAEVKPLDEAKEDPMLLDGTQSDLSPIESTSGNGVDGGADHGSESSEPSGPRYPFRDATSLLALCRKHNLTIAQLVYENEKSHGYTDEEIYHKLFKIWQVMDTSILESVQAPLDTKLPGSLKLHRRAPALYRRLTRGLYSTAGHTSPNPLDKGTGEKASLPGFSSGSGSGSGSASTPATISKSKVPGLSIGRRQPPRILGSLDHPITPSPSRRTTFPTMDYLTVYAIAVNETNAAGGRIVTAPTNGAAGIIPAVLKYTIEFISDDPERDIPTFLLTAAAIGMLYKRGATISAAEGGCMAEVGVACSMAAGAFAACMGASPEAIEQAAEIGIEHNLGLTCDPIGGLVQAPCIERNALGAIKAISSANLALSSETGTQKVRLDDAIRAMRLTAKGMRNEFKETSLSGLATSVPFNIPVSVPDC
ncbi:L-serine ammonia-lyase [Colletotrichum phormii]|uniref:L-serine ammonia-lyase n=1 Tax=Colletotrichum phormii TaxID=359342 RepID=A0AAI9ZUG7_9PEZI|nr:L-serine ammonia-lyase [Colletotrichum phormii]KAK1638070.1 L-serine ammonia-lyase [Colletotrichum phormii]